MTGPAHDPSVDWIAVIVISAPAGSGDVQYDLSASGSALNRMNAVAEHTRIVSTKTPAD